MKHGAGGHPCRIPSAMGAGHMHRPLLLLLMLLLALLLLLLLLPLSLLLLLLGLRDASRQRPGSYSCLY